MLRENSLAGDFPKPWNQQPRSQQRSPAATVVITTLAAALVVKVIARLDHFMVLLQVYLLMREFIYAQGNDRLH